MSADETEEWARACMRGLGAHLRRINRAVDAALVPDPEPDALEDALGLLVGEPEPLTRPILCDACRAHAPWRFLHGAKMWICRGCDQADDEHYTPEQTRAWKRQLRAMRDQARL